MSKAQTDNSFLADKIALRVSMIPEKDTLAVLDAFHGYGTIWKNIEAIYSGKISITKIDTEQKDDRFVLIGDNTKFLSSLPIEKYDVVDLDAYGVPYDQMKIVFERGFKGLVFVTFIQSVLGQIPKKMLSDIGYPPGMVEKCPTLFSKNGHDKFCRWLYLNGIRTVSERVSGRKCYFGFNIE